MLQFRYDRILRVHNAQPDLHNNINITHPGEQD